MVFPLLVVLVTIVLGALKLNGSSVSIYALPGLPDDDGGLVAGRARNLRTDEWFVRTPLVARQEALALPERDRIGVGEHDTALINDLPTGGWESFVRPHTLPYRVFGIEHAFAFEWWIVFLALPAIGLYAFALALGIRVLTAALIAMILVLSPVVQWWSIPWTGASIGYACAAAVALLAATRATSLSARAGLGRARGMARRVPRRRVLPAVGWCSMALVVGAATVAAIAKTFPQRQRRREWWMRQLLVLGIAVLVAGALVDARSSSATARRSTRSPAPSTRAGDEAQAGRGTWPSSSAPPSTSSSRRRSPLCRS